MTNRGIRFAVVSVAFSLAAGGSAEAAKGVKKAGGANSMHMITGHVISVTSKNGGISFHVRTAQNHKKRAAGAVNAVAGGNHQHVGREFHVTAATHFMHQNGTPASVALLHQGERVRVQAMGHQAMNVQILSQQHPRTNVVRHRAQVYHPQRYKHRRR